MSSQPKILYIRLVCSRNFVISAVLVFIYILLVVLYSSPTNSKLVFTFNSFERTHDGSRSLEGDVQDDAITMQEDNKFIEVPATALKVINSQSNHNADVINANDNSNDVVRISDDELRDLLSHSSSCELLSTSLTNISYLSSGWTKSVYSAFLKGRPVAVKVASGEGHDVKRCMQTSFRHHKSLDDCLALAERKLLKEIVLLHTLRHENIVKLLHFCVPATNESISEERQSVVIVTELGEDVDIIKLLQMSWEDRLRVVYGLTKLLNFLSKTSHGSVALNDFRRRQFVLVDGELKLSDVDDVGLHDDVCTTDDDCVQHFPTANVIIRSTCYNSWCQQHSEKKNLLWASTHFTSFLLSHGTPNGLQRIVQSIVEGYGNMSLDVDSLFSLTEQLVQLYGSGKYLQSEHEQREERDRRSYIYFGNTDLPGLHDYRCRFAVTSDVCTISVLNADEAAEMCDEEGSCYAFVISHKRTWTGRYLAFLKNNGTGHHINNDTSLYVRVEK